MSYAPPLLCESDPAPFDVIEGHPDSPYLMTADHAGRLIPTRLGDLGLSATELQRHIAWDIGIAAVSRLVQAELSAFLILQTYSRLVIDCNRPLESPTSIADLSEHTTIPGNVGLAEADRTQRVAEIFLPYHARIEQELERRERAGERTILLTMHSFTPCYKGVDRPWHVGVLYNRDTRLAHRLLGTLAAEGLNVGNNEPYFVSDDSDYAIPRYGEQRGHLHVEIEVRQDLITDAPGQARIAPMLSRAIRAAVGPLL